MTQINTPMNSSISVVVASNNDAVLRASLFASPDLDGSVEVVIERNAASAAKAYNAGLDRSRGELVVFVHQDVFLPPGWTKSLHEATASLDSVDPTWAVLGVFGIDHSARARGWLYSTGLKRIVGAPLPQPLPVQALDEVVIVLRRSSGLRFDDALPGFHLYGTDICQEARRRGFQAYAFQGFCIHNTNGIGVLPIEYWKAWLHIRSKWWAVLPITTPCMTVSRWALPAVRYLAKESLRRGLLIPQEEPGHRIDNPEALWEGLKDSVIPILNSVAEMQSSEEAIDSSGTASTSAEEI
jgi:hypothetical protein